MNILLLYPKDPSHPWIRPHFCEKSLRKEHHVETFDLLQSAPCIPPPVLRKWGIQLYRGKRVHIRSVIDQCKEKPEVIIQVEGVGFYHLAGYKDIGIPTAYWGFDAHIPICLAFQRSIAKDFDYMFVAMKDYLPLFREIHDNAYWLPFAADPELHRRYIVEKLFDLGYVGNFGVSKLHRHKIELLTRVRKRYNALFVSGIWAEHVTKVYSMSRIGFNKSVGGDLNPRVFEVMSSGTMLLTDKIGNGLEELFINKKHLVTYGGEEELYALIPYYLENEEEREEIARAGQKEVHEKHTYDLRMRTMLEVMGL